jgi:hypothetical protein
MRRAFRYDDLRARYFEVLESCARSDRSQNWLLTRLEDAVGMIADSAHADPLKPNSNDEFDAAVNDLRRFALTRADYVHGEVTRLVVR